MTLGEKLQFLRKQKGISQEKLAEQLSVSRQAISKWETGDSLPDTENILKLSRLFAVSTDYLLRDDIEQTAEAPRENKHTAPGQSSVSFSVKLIAGIVCFALGLIGNVSFLILSTMIKVPVTKKRLLPDGSVQYYGGGDVLGYSFWGFISEYHLQALLVLFTTLIVAGLFILWLHKRSDNAVSKDH